VGIMDTSPAARARRIVGEARPEITAEPRRLENRDSVQTCVAGIQTTTCLDSQTCCQGASFESLVACIPANSICCDYTTAVGFCPSSASCADGRFESCIGTMVPNFQTALPTTSQPTPIDTPPPSSKSSGVPAIEYAAPIVSNLPA
jgi:hypothetical protein